MINYDTIFLLLAPFFSILFLSFFILIFTGFRDFLYG